MRGGWALRGIMVGIWGWSLGTRRKDWAGLRLICSRTQKVQYQRAKLDHISAAVIHCLKTVPPG